MVMLLLNRWLRRIRMLLRLVGVRLSMIGMMLRMKLLQILILKLLLLLVMMMMRVNGDGRERGASAGRSTIGDRMRKGVSVSRRAEVDTATAVVSCMDEQMNVEMNEWMRETVTVCRRTEVNAASAVVSCVDE